MNIAEAIKALTQSESEDEIDRIWHMGKNREVAYDSELLTMPARATEVIEALDKNYALGIVSSRVKENIYEAPALRVLENYFDVAVGYQDTNNHKPHPEPLLFAAQKLGVDPEECIYIGDAPSDFQAGKAAGMKVIIYSRNRHNEADAHADSFIELPALINSLTNPILSSQSQ